jgi:hypothetical protein
MAGINGFREAFLSAGLQDETPFTDWEARKLRYAMYWAFYENTAYKNLHTWAISYRQQQALYRYIRGIYNPAYRLGEFWKAHVWGGMLDYEAGDGNKKQSAIPIETENEKLRPAIAQVWKWSNWQVRKGILSLYGSVLGDVGLQVVDDVDKGKVYLQIIHPAIIKSVDMDAWGNVKGYEFEETREHPLSPGLTVTYTETAEREGESVIFRTLLNGQPYAWNGVSGEWSEPYGFVPLVMVQHNNVGLDYGWSELHAGRAKVQELDDLSSKLGDQIRKMVDAPWLMAGVEKPRAGARAQGATPTMDAPAPGREETPVLYGPLGASATPLVAPLDITAAGNHIMGILAEIERDYPELQMDIWTAKGATSGRALRLARERVETKVQGVRPNYDDPLVRAQQMAVAIGGFRGYKPFGGFGLESYAKGDLEHSIGERPAFRKDPFDDIEFSGAFWAAAKTAVDTGLPLMVYLEREGWSEKDLKRVAESPEMEAKMQGLKMATMMGNNLDAGQQEGGGPDTAQNNQQAEEEV